MYVSCLDNAKSDGLVFRCHRDTGEEHGNAHTKDEFFIHNDFFIYFAKVSKKTDKPFGELTLILYICIKVI